VQDRYLYLPSFGWSLAFALAAVRLAATSPRARTAVGTAMALLLVAYMATAMEIQHYWHDDITFFEQCVAVDPVRAEYRRRLADAMDKTGDSAGAARELEQGIKLDPGDPYLHLRITQEYAKLGRQQDFEREFEKFNELSGMTLPESAGESLNSSQPAAAP
jgi:tetratricopeptide (TPR) repeat protein